MLLTWFLLLEDNTFSLLGLHELRNIHSRKFILLSVSVLLRNSKTKAGLGLVKDVQLCLASSNSVGICLVVNIKTIHKEKNGAGEARGHDVFVHGIGAVESLDWRGEFEPDLLRGKDDPCPAGDDDESGSEFLDIVGLKLAILLQIVLCRAKSVIPILLNRGVCRIITLRRMERTAGLDVIIAKTNAKIAVVANAHVGDKILEVHLASHINSRDCEIAEQKRKLIVSSCKQRELGLDGGGGSASTTGVD